MNRIICSTVDFSSSPEKIVKFGISNSLGKGIIFSIHSGYGFRHTGLLSGLNFTPKFLLMISAIIFESIPTGWLAGCTGAAVVVQESAETPAVDYLVVEHSADGKQTINYSADSSVAESSAETSEVESSVAEQQTANNSTDYLDD